MRQLTNFATTTLSSSLSSGATSASVTDGSVFPASGDFIIKIENEFIKVTARSSNTLTIVRAQEGTSDVTHSSGLDIKLILTSGTMDGWFGDIATIGGYASRPSSPRIGQQYFANDIDAGWMYNGTNWDLIHPLFVPYSKRVDISTWTSFNLSTSTWTDYNGILTAELPTSGSVAARGYYKNVPSAPYKAKCIIRSLHNAHASNFLGIALSDTTKFRSIVVLGATATSISADSWNSVTSFNSTQFRIPFTENPYTWLCIEDDNTNWKWSYSRDGLNWAQVYSVARNNFLTATKIGLFVERNESQYPSTIPYQFLAYWEE